MGKLKVRVTKVEEQKPKDGDKKVAEYIVLEAIITDPTDNSIAITMHITDESLWGTFEVDKDYTVDFTPIKK